MKNSSAQNKIEVVYAGGTISSLATPKGYREGGHAVDLVSLLNEKNPSLRNNFILGQTEIAYTGLSENIDEGYWNKIEDVIRRVWNKTTKAIIVTHGTDSMEQTARRLKKIFDNDLNKSRVKIILTGANDDIAYPGTDAWDNLMFAFESANNDCEPNVYIAFHRKLIPAELVVKEPFNGHEMNFVSKDDRNYIFVLKRREKEEQELIAKLQQSINSFSNATRAIEYEVNIVRTGHDEFIRQVVEQNIKAVVLILYHSGTANTEKPELSVSHLVKKLRGEKNIIFFGVTENGEPVNLHSYETSVKLCEAGVVPLYNMQKAVAFAKLQLVATGKNIDIIDEMLDDKAGEIDESRIIAEDIDKLKKLY